MRQQWHQSSIVDRFRDLEAVVNSIITKNKTLEKVVNLPPGDKEATHKGGRPGYFVPRIYRESSFPSPWLSLAVVQSRLRDGPAQVDWAQLAKNWEHQRIEADKETLRQEILQLKAQCVFQVSVAKEQGQKLQTKITELEANAHQTDPARIKELEPDKNRLEARVKDLETLQLANQQTQKLAVENFEARIKELEGRQPETPQRTAEESEARIKELEAEKQQAVEKAAETTRRVAMLQARIDELQNDKQQAVDRATKVQSEKEADAQTLGARIIALEAEKQETAVQVEQLEAEPDQEPPSTDPGILRNRIQGQKKTINMLRLKVSTGESKYKKLEEQLYFKETRLEKVVKEKWELHLKHQALVQSCQQLTREKDAAMAENRRGHELYDAEVEDNCKVEAPAIEEVAVQVEASAAIEEPRPESPGFEILGVKEELAPSPAQPPEVVQAPAPAVQHEPEAAVAEPIADDQLEADLPAPSATVGLSPDELGAHVISAIKVVNSGDVKGQGWTEALKWLRWVAQTGEDPVMMVGLRRVPIQVKPVIEAALKRVGDEEEDALCAAAWRLAIEVKKREALVPVQPQPPVQPRVEQ